MNVIYMSSTVSLLDAVAGIFWSSARTDSAAILALKFWLCWCVSISLHTVAVAVAIAETISVKSCSAGCMLNPWWRLVGLAIQVRWWHDCGVCLRMPKTKSVYSAPLGIQASDLTYPAPDRPSWTEPPLRCLHGGLLQPVVLRAVHPWGMYGSGEVLGYAFVLGGSPPGCGDFAAFGPERWVGQCRWPSLNRR